MYKLPRFPSLDKWESTMWLSPSMEPCSAWNNTCNHFALTYSVFCYSHKSLTQSPYKEELFLLDPGGTDFLVSWAHYFWAWSEAVWAYKNSFWRKLLTLGATGKHWTRQLGSSTTIQCACAVEHCYTEHSGEHPKQGWQTGKQHPTGRPVCALGFQDRHFNDSAVYFSYTLCSFSSCKCLLSFK